MLTVPTPVAKYSAVELIARAIIEKIDLIKKEMSMPVLVDLFLVLSKIITTVECAPKLGEILFDPLSFEAAELERIARFAVDVKKKLNKSSLDVIIENGTNNLFQSTNSITKINAREQTISILALKKSSESNKILEVTKPVHERSKHENTNEQNSQESPVVNNIIIDSSSEWLDPETESTETETVKQISRQTLHVETDVKMNKSLETHHLPIGRDYNPVKRQTTKKYLHVASQSERGERPKAASKREINTPQKIFMKLLRSAANAHIHTNDSGKPCDGYDYDVTICRYIGDRYLCGYNKNLGDLKDSEEFEDLGNGCRIRGNRMECGYKDGPFSNDTNRLDDDANVQVVKLAYKKTTPHSTTTNSKHLNKANSSTESVQKMKTSDNAKPAQNITANQTKQACMEKDDRIVCYNIPV